MQKLIGVIFLAFFLNATIPAGTAQLRNLSEYSVDRINTDKTYFTLKENETADFAWASEWTHTAAYAYPEKAIMFLWHFKDGSKAYTRQGDLLGDAGQSTGYLLTDRSANLEDAHRKKIQPMSLTNYPVKIELWLGDIQDTSGFSPEMPVDRACFNELSIELNRSYRFAACR